MDTSPALLLYILTDVSGSTVRDGFGAGWNQALPRFVDMLETVAGPRARLCLLTYADEAAVRTVLQPAADLVDLPIVASAGLSGMAAGLGLLARTIGDDRAQLDADGVEVRRPVVLIVADGLPTDDDDEVLDARALLPDDVHLAVPAGTGALEVAALSRHRHDLSVGTAAAVADSLVVVVETLLRAAVAGQDGAPPD
jgi:hypothetical protein